MKFKKLNLLLVTSTLFFSTGFSQNVPSLIQLQNFIQSYYIDELDLDDDDTMESLGQDENIDPLGLRDDDPLGLRN